MHEKVIRQNVKTTEGYRSYTQHIKVYSKVILNRINHSIKNNLGKNQCNFRKG